MPQNSPDLAAAREHRKLGAAASNRRKFLEPSGGERAHVRFALHRFTSRTEPLPLQGADVCGAPAPQIRQDTHLKRVTGFTISA